MYIKKALDLCSHVFSTSSRTVKIMSGQPRFFLKPHCESGSTSQPDVVAFYLLSWQSLFQPHPVVRCPTSCRTLSGLPFLVLVLRLRPPSLLALTSLPILYAIASGASQQKHYHHKQLSAFLARYQTCVPLCHSSACPLRLASPPWMVV